MANAPAQETIYTIKTVSALPVDLQQVRQPLIAALQEHFVIVEDFSAFSTTIQQPASDNPAVSTETRPMGFRFKTHDGGHVAHFMHDGLVVNWLRASYQGFEPSMNLLGEYWRIYQEFFQPISVDHVSLRYINQIHLPLESGNSLRISDFMLHGPKLPEIPGLSFAGFQQYSELVKRPEEIRTRVMTATLNQVDGALPVLFDYESFLHLQGGDRRETESIWASLRKVHEWCGHFFNETLTTRCRSLFS